jgi:hypothetical protein
MENRKFITCNKPLYVVQRIFYLCFVLFPTLVFAQSSVANKSQIHLTNGAVFFSNEENANKKHVEKIHITSGAQLVISPQTKLTVVQKRKSSSFVPKENSQKKIKELKKKIALNQNKIQHTNRFVNHTSSEKFSSSHQFSSIAIPSIQLSQDFGKHHEFVFHVFDFGYAIVLLFLTAGFVLSISHNSFRVRPPPFHLLYGF